MNAPTTVFASGRQTAVLSIPVLLVGLVFIEILSYMEVAARCVICKCNCKLAASKAKFRLRYSDHCLALADRRN
jgi:hypothetical protein